MTRNTISTVENIFSVGQSTGDGFEPVARENALFKDSLPDRTRSLLPSVMNLVRCDSSPNSFSASRPATILTLTHLTKRSRRSRNESQRRDRYGKKYYLGR